MLLRTPQPIRSVLVANRGEIAVRILATCRRLGLRGIAVYSEADATAPHVALADIAVCIGPAAARASYLNIDAIMAAVRATGADAVHPGYGFLSENATFAAACRKAEVVFVGPSPEAVASMGSKIESKRIAERIGVPTVPGYHGDAEDEQTLRLEAERIGFPVLIKASAGGGGRGMRRVDSPADFATALNAARAEAESAFGDRRVLIEKFIANPRHLEVQLAGDKHGNLVHLFERDCSVQRNNQKVLEEAPAPNLPDSVRDKLYAAAIALGRAIKYDNVGTVEFIMDAGSTDPYFLEMNTRLQVEHPVTEMITGIDLVEWQLRVAAGEPLPLQQGDIRRHGHAIEARLAAERVDLGYQPSTGTVQAVLPPTDARFDCGIAAGSQVGLHYDSMLAKVIGSGRDRNGALASLATALRQVAVLGVGTNQAFLRDAVDHPTFAEGRATTRFIPNSFPKGWSVSEAELRLLRAAAALFWLAPGGDMSASPDHRQPDSPWVWRQHIRVTAAARPATCDLILSDDYGSVKVRSLVGRTCACMIFGDVAEELGPFSLSGDKLIFTPPGQVPQHFLARKSDDLIHISHNGLALSARVVLAIEAPRASDVAATSGHDVFAPLPGLISQIMVKVGDTIEAGVAVAQMEAMKLVHTLNAPVTGTVKAIHHNVGDTVTNGKLLIEFTPQNEKESS